MRVLIATGIFPPDIGGPAIYSARVAEELIKKGHTVKVLTYSKEAPPISNCLRQSRESSTKLGQFSISNKLPITNYQLPIVTVSRKLPVALRYCVYFLQVLWRGRDVDVIFLQDPVSAGVPTTLANLFLRKRIVLKIVGDYAWEQSVQFPIANFQFPIKSQISNYNFKILDNFYPFNSKEYPFKIRLLQKMQTWVAKRADAIITPSEYLKGIVKKWGISGNKISVIYNAAKLSDIGAEKEKDDFTIVSAGRLVPWKGYDRLIEVFAELCKVYPNLRLKIIGRGPQISNIQLLISNYKLQNRVELLGSLPHRETLQEMANADLFVLNTAYEGLSHVILEALAVGTPVVATDVGGNPEVIKDGWNGILIQYNDSEALKSAIMKMIEDRDFREMCVKNGLKSLEKFDEREMLNKTFQVLSHK